MKSIITVNNESLLLCTEVKTETNLEQLELKSSCKNQVTLFSDNIVIEDQYIINDNFITIKRKINILRKDKYKIELQIKHGIDNLQVFIPGVIFKNNSEGKGCFPRIDENKFWSFDESRMSIPGFIEVYNNEEVFLIGHRSNVIHSSTSWDSEGVSFTIPSKEWPFAYVGKNKLIKANVKTENDYRLFDKNEIIEQEYLLYFNRIGYKNIFDEYIKYSRKFLNTGKTKKNSLSNDDFKALILRQLLFLVETSDNGSYIKMGKGNGKFQEYYDFTSASFLIKSIEAATIFNNIDIVNLKRKISPEVKQILEKEENKKLIENSYKKLAMSIGDYFLRAENPIGIFRDCHSLTDDIWGGYLGIGENNDFQFLINSRTNGEVLLAYLELSKACDNIHREKYINLIDNVCSFYLSNQLEDGSYGRWWNENGVAIDKKGTNGSHILLFFIKYYKETNRTDLLISIQKAIKYYEKLIITLDFFGDTLDADSCDKEAGVILLRTFLELYELEEFHISKYLKLCKICANFVSTWIQQDNIHFDEDTPLGKLKYKTRGLTSVSIANQHLDLYGMLIAYDFLKLNKYTCEEIYRTFAIDMIRSSKQLIATPNNLLGRDSNFIGWLPEQINHTNWDYFNDKNKAPGYYAINISWVHVLVLDYFLKIENEFSEVLKWI